MKIHNINNEELQLMINDNYCVSYLTYVILNSNTHYLRNNRKYYNGGKCVVTYIYTCQLYRNNGYATKLLQYLKNLCKKFGVDIIELDDCSDNFGKNNNLYINNGFTYYEYGHPEMYLNFI